MEPNRPELALLRGKRGPEDLALWVEHFGEGNQALASRYALAVATFLGEPPRQGAEEWDSYVGRLSPNTRQAYAYAVTEFFEWLAHKYDRVVPPHRVLRKDAEDYVNWLSVRPYALVKEKLEDGDEPLRLAIYQAIQNIGGGADRRSILAMLPSNMRNIGLDNLTPILGRMVLHDLLERRPTLEQVRQDWPRAGIDQFSINIESPDGTKAIALDDIFQYSLPSSRGVSRTTIAVRLAALSAFWKVLAQGENVPGGEAILQHDVFVQVKKRVTRGLGVEKKQAAAGQRMAPGLVPRLLAAANDARTLTEKRDKALFYFLVFTGARVSEVIKLRRGQPLAAEINKWPGWFMSNAEPPMVRVRRKGGKMMSLPYPPVALAALADFQAELERRAAPVGAQDVDPRVRGYIQPDSPRWRYRELAIMPDAPLFPPISFWGANSTINYQELKPNLPGTYGPPGYARSMTRHGVTKLLRRLAVKAGLSDDEAAQVHPHAVRHFAATAMGKGGKDIREIQAIMGHESITTTEGYLADVEGTVALSGQHEILQYISELGGTTAVPAPAPRAPRAKVVETTAIPMPQPPPEPSAPKPSHMIPGSPPSPEQELTAIEVLSDPELSAEELPAHMIPEVPAAPLAPHAEEAEPGPEPSEPVVAVEGEEEPRHVPATVLTHESHGGDWEWVYEALRTKNEPEHMEFTELRKRNAASKDLVTIEPPDRTQKVSGPTRDNPHGHQFLASFYDPWPEHYGIGTGSLLPWFTRGQPRVDGRVTAQDPVTGEVHEIPVLPVLAPEQVYPESSQPAPLLDFVEQLYSEWLTGDPAQGIGPSPTRTYGLVRWFGFFAYTTAHLEEFLAEHKRADSRTHIPKWMPWDAVVPLGDLRSHNQQWLESWFRENAHTYVTAVRQFHKVKRGKGERGSDEAFWKHFERTVMENVAFVDELPSWFADDDPIKAIYDSDPDEWDSFVAWLANVTGMRLSKERAKARDAAQSYAETDIEAKRDAARDLLENYFDNREHLYGAMQALRGAVPAGAEGAAADYAGMPKDELRRTVETLRAGQAKIATLLSQLGVAEPGGEQEEEKRVGIKKRIENALTSAFPDPELTEPNVFVRSDLFDPGFFRIDFKQHTITHDDEYREAFRQRFDGRDSELVMRRAARAMWEYAKRTGEREQPKDYGYVYGVMLAYVSWIVPSGPEMERQMLETGRVVVQGPEGRREWLRRQAMAMKELKYGEPHAESAAAGALTEAERALALIETMKAKGFSIGAEEAENAIALHDAHQLHAGIITPADVDAAMLHESRKRALMVETGLNEREADAALRRFDATGTPVDSGWTPDAFAGIAEEVGEEGSMRVIKREKRLTKEEEKRLKTEELARHGPVIQVIRRGKTVPEGERVIVITPKSLKENPSTFEALQGERATRWYRVEMPAGSELKPNRGRVSYVSAGALARKHKMMANARAVLPSPFRMLVAMVMPRMEAT